MDRRSGDGSTVELRDGRIRGVVSDGVTRFKGIPYAASTAGGLRWLPPQPVKPWTGILDAFDYGPSCPQPSERPPGWSHEERESEDCLVLNIWAPSPLDPSSRRPVMVWFHGGLYTIGSGSWPLYDGTSLANRGDVVVVTVNHRLGPFGFLYLAEIGGGDYASSGNAGMLDLIACLEWVRDNIEAFGGDPANVTVFGESGGGAKVSTLLAMPAARGLFHRAAVQSGPGLWASTPDDAAEVTSKLLSELGIGSGSGSLDALLKTPAARLVEAQRIFAPRGARPMRRSRGSGLPGGFTPVVDGVALPAHPGDSLENGNAIDVPVLIGRNKDEATMFLAMDPVLYDPSSLDEEGLRERLSVFEGFEEKLIDVYRAGRPDATPLDLLIAIQTDSFMGSRTIEFAERKLQGGNEPVFMYLFCWGAGPLRSGHGYEIAFVFDNTRPPVMESSESRSELAARMSDAWIAFAHKGDPNHPRLPEWPSYSVQDRATMIFNRGDCKVENDPFSAERLVWREIS